MKSNVFYTYLRKKMDVHDNFEYFELYYNIKLSSGKFSKAWDPVLNQEMNGDYSIDLSGSSNGDKHIIELEDRNSPSTNAIDLDGVIRITGIPETFVDTTVTLSLKGGGTNEGGSTKHMGDGD